MDIGRTEVDLVFPGLQQLAKRLIICGTKGTWSGKNDIEHNALGTLSQHLSCKGRLDSSRPRPGAEISQLGIE